MRSDLNKNFFASLVIARILPALAVSAGVAAGCAQWVIYAYAPLEKTMGATQKIFYIHMPLAWWSLFSFLVACVASILYLVKRRLVWDNLALSSVEVGVLFATLALITGSLWASRAWGVWWTWDPKLTATLVLWFAFCVCLLLRKTLAGRRQQAVGCAVLSIVAFLDAPLVFYAAKLWRGIHPDSFFQAGSEALDPAMKTAILFCLFATGLLWLALTLMRSRLAFLADAIRSLVASHDDV